MSLEKLAKTVKFLKEEMEESTVFGVYEDDIKVLLETCQLVLASSGAVEDEPESCECCDPEYYKDCGCAVESWNACNEANRVARVKWLNGKLEGLKRKLTVPMMDIVRQHFERG